MRKVFSMGLRVFVALVMIGLIQQQLVDEYPSSEPPGPKFISPNAETNEDLATDDPMTFQKMLDLAAAAARDLLGGGAPPPIEEKSSLEQLQARSR